MTSFWNNALRRRTWAHRDSLSRVAPLWADPSGLLGRASWPGGGGSGWSETCARPSKSQKAALLSVEGRRVASMLFIKRCTLEEEAAACACLGGGRSLALNCRHLSAPGGRSASGGGWVRKLARLPFRNGHSVLIWPAGQLRPISLAASDLSPCARLFGRSSGGTPHPISDAGSVPPTVRCDGATCSPNRDDRCRYFESVAHHGFKREPSRAPASGAPDPYLMPPG